MASVEFSDLPVANTPEDINKVVTALNELKAAVNSIDLEQFSGTLSIPYSILALTGLIRNADIKSDAAIAHTKLDLDGMDLDNIAAETLNSAALGSDLESTSSYQNVASTPAVSGDGLYLVIGQLVHKVGPAYSNGSSLLKGRLVNLITAQQPQQDDVYYQTGPTYHTQLFVDLFSMSNGHTATLQFQGQVHGAPVYADHWAIATASWIKAIKLQGT